MTVQASTTMPAATAVEIAALPDWPTRTIAVLATVDQDGPYAIPVSAPVRAGDRRVVLNLHRSRGSLDRLRARPHVALVILTEGNAAFTARGRARIVRESMDSARQCVAVAIDVDQMDDDRQTAFAVQAGVGRRWVDERERDALGARVRAPLVELAASGQTR